MQPAILTTFMKVRVIQWCMFGGRSISNPAWLQSSQIEVRISRYRRMAKNWRCCRVTHKDRREWIGTVCSIILMLQRCGRFARMCGY